MTPSQHFFPGLTYADCRAEVDREHAWRTRTYPDRVAGGRMHRADADYQLAIFAAIGADVDRMTRPYAPPPHGYSWDERRKALSREIGWREEQYDELVAGGRLTRDRADHQLACLRAILWTYDTGFDWRPSNGTPAQSAQDMLDGKPETPEQRETWAEMDAIWRPGTGLFYQRWPNADTPTAEPMLAI